MATYLEFEEKIKKIEEDIIIAKTKADEPAVEILNKKLDKEVEKTFKNLNDYQKLQLARHPDRPYALDYINALLQMLMKFIAINPLGVVKPFFCI